MERRPQPQERQLEHEEAESIKIIAEIDNQLEQLEEQHQELIEKADRGEPVCFAEHGRTIDYDESTDSLYFYGKGGSKTPLTWGDVRSASLFGVEFKFGDTTITPGDPAEDEGQDNARHSEQKAFIAVMYTERRVHLEHLKQAYQGSINPLNRNCFDQAYTGIYESLRSDDAELRRGVLAEKMFYAYLLKYFSDHPNVGFPFDPGPEMDAEYKVDLVIQLPMQVTAEGPNVIPPQVAIQFGSNPSEAAVEHKMKMAKRGMDQLQRELGGISMFDSYAIITSDKIADNLSDAYARWRPQLDDGRSKPINKCDPRGPLFALSEDEEQSISEQLEPLFAELRKLQTARDL